MLKQKEWWGGGGGGGGNYRKDGVLGIEAATARGGQFCQQQLVRLPVGD